VYRRSAPRRPGDTDGCRPPRGWRCAYEGHGRSCWGRSRGTTRRAIETGRSRRCRGSTGGRCWAAGPTSGCRYPRESSMRICGWIMMFHLLSTNVSVT